jgi:hypothetical protein
VGRAAEKQPGLVQGFRARRAQWAEMGQKDGSPGLAGSMKKAEALLGRRGMGRGKEVGYVAD